MIRLIFSRSSLFYNFRLISMSLICYLCILSVNQGFASENFYAQKSGNYERKQINSTLRKVVEKELKKPVIFRIDALKLSNRWAFFRGTVLEKSGKPIDYRGTPYQELIDAGTFDDWICALFRKKGNQWQLVTHVIGATDVPFIDWVDRYGAPSSIFK